MDGSLEVWDLFHKHNEPTLTVRDPDEAARPLRAALLRLGAAHSVQTRIGCVRPHQTLLYTQHSMPLTNGPCTQHSRPPQVKVTDQALTSFAVQSNGAVVAVGTVDGATHVLRLSAGLAEMAQNEKQGINAMLERETLRWASVCVRARVVQRPICGCVAAAAAHARGGRLKTCGHSCHPRKRCPSRDCAKRRIHDPNPPGRRTWTKRQRRPRSRRGARRWQLRTWGLA